MNVVTEKRIANTRLVDPEVHAPAMDIPWGTLAARICGTTDIGKHLGETCPLRASFRPPRNIFQILLRIIFHIWQLQEISTRAYANFPCWIYTADPLDYCGIACLVKGRGPNIIMYCKADPHIPDFYQHRQVLAQVTAKLKPRGKGKKGLAANTITALVSPKLTTQHRRKIWVECRQGPREKVPLC
ncbi:hypothetical protein B0H14DRAFT_2617200 [Mycena olivaceomarginata]|nr:hypothetical protein B0H14DRAFT_2617200 [Mycena olivaceomarginata]